MKALIGIGLALTVLASTAAFATEIIQTDENTINVPSYGIDGSFTDGFSQFNPALGTLNSVTIALSGTGDYMGTFKLDSSCPSAASCSSVAFFSTGINIVDAPGLPSQSVLGPFQFLEDYGGVLIEGTNLSPISHSFGIGVGPLGASSVTGYIGAGEVSVMDGISEDSDECTFSGVDCTLTDSINLYTTLTYNYTPVPEPISLTLFTAGLAGAVALRRRKKAQ